MDAKRSCNVPVISISCFTLGTRIHIWATLLTVGVCACFILFAESVCSISIWNYTGVDTQRSWNVPVVSSCIFTLSTCVLVDSTLLTVRICATFDLLVNWVYSKKVWNSRDMDALKGH